MLEFWFNPQLSMTKKIAYLVIVAIMTAILYSIQPLELKSILMFLATGLVFLICRYCKLQFLQNKPIGVISRLLTWIPIALLLAFIFINMQNGSMLLPGAQGIGFMILATCLFSPWSLFKK